MMLFWTLSCLLTVTTVNLVQAETTAACSKCNSSSAYMEVADEMIRKAKFCASKKCDSSTVYLEITEQMVRRAKTCASNKCGNSTVYIDVSEQMIRKAKTCVSSMCDSSTAYLEVAEQMMKNAKTKCTQPPSPSGDLKPMDCWDVLQAGHNESGVYKVWPRSRVMAEGSLDVYCDMDTDGGGWTVIQRRGNYSNPRDYFYKDWASYKEGFGNIEEDFWLGNDAIHALSTQRQTSVRFDLEDVEGTRKHALYDFFWIEDESHKYLLHVSNYSGDAGDSFRYHDDQMFSTKDRDNDKLTGSCAQDHKGGWWYKACRESNLNGLYQPGKFTGKEPDRVTWKSFKGDWECLQTTEIKLRPRDFEKKRPTGSSTLSAKQDVKSSHFFIKAIGMDI